MFKHKHLRMWNCKMQFNIWENHLTAIYKVNNAFKVQRFEKKCLISVLFIYSHKDEHNHFIYPTWNVKLAVLKSDTESKLCRTIQSTLDIMQVLGDSFSICVTSIDIYRFWNHWYSVYLSSNWRRWNLRYIKDLHFTSATGTDHQILIFMPLHWSIHIT